MTSFHPTNASSSVSEKDIYRIQVSLASMKTSVRVVPTYARVFVLEERFEVPQNVGQQSGTEQPLPVRHTHEWKLVCTGIPCVLTDRQSPHATSPFAVKVAVAEAESGLATWDCAVEPSSDYRATQSNFHTFRSVTHSMYGIQFLCETQAQSMFAYITELLSADLHLSRHAGALWYLDGEGAEKEKEERKKHRSFSVSKKDISKPCNFVHLAGITSKRTTTCEKELTGTMRRMKERSMSLGNLHYEEPQKTTPKVSKKFSFRKSKWKSSKTDSPQVGTPFATQTNGAPVAPTSVHEYSTFRARSASDVPKFGLTKQPYSTASLGFEPSVESEIDTMFTKKRLELGSQPVKATVPEYVFQTNSSFRPTASIGGGGGSSKSVSPTDGPPTTANRTSASQIPTFSTAAFARGYNPLPSKFAPMYSSTASLTSEGKPKRRRDSNRARVSISDSMSNLSSAYGLDEDEEESPFLVERYAQQGPETSVEASLVPIMDPDEYCNEVGKRGLRATTGPYSYSTYSRNMAKQRESAQGVLRRPASSVSVNSSSPIRRSSSGQLTGGGGVQAARPPSPSSSSHSSGSKKTNTSAYPSDSTGQRQSLTDTAQLVSQYTERMSEALQMFDNLVLTGLDYGGNPPSSTRLSSSDVHYGTLSSEV